MPQNRVNIINPLEDARWPEFIDRHPDASVFHTRGWLQSLQDTYQYKPVAFTTSPPREELRNAVVFCEVRSWLTGRRLVSLPFSDHCEPLVESPDDLNELLHFIEDFRKRNSWKYVEIRPVVTRPPAPDGFHESENYFLHQLDLKPDLNDLLHSFHKDCVQRKIRRAEREGLEYEEGRNESQLRKLYDLLALTRRRHNVPPQPYPWFRNVLKNLRDGACIRIASKDGLPVAGILTLHQGKKYVYKYGGSNASFNNLGGMVLLFWKSIQEARSAGADEFDFGRSDTDNPGLIAFKEHWAAPRRTLTYWRQSGSRPAVSGAWKTQFPKKVFSCLPGVMQASVGRVLYRHIG